MPGSGAGFFLSLFIELPEAQYGQTQPRNPSDGEKFHHDCSSALIDFAALNIKRP